LNLIITCQRNLEEQTIDEISNFLDEFGDSNPEVSKTEFPGIIQVDTSIDPLNVITKIRKKISDEPWLIRFCSRLIPIQKECKSDLNLITNTIEKMVLCMKENQSYRITIEKRNSQMKSKEIISHIADLISNKVSLEHPDWEIIIQIMGKITGIGILPKNSILSVNREKRLDLC
jgi:tRNA acetyltransferase TAN1|tara:strand:+ start:1322 stop:1843 length:522 start_codon:yes stop_codon:yes gene_type:complete